MGAFQRLPKGRPWGGSRSPWRCWAFRPCWAWWQRPSTMSTTATRLRSCRSSLQIRRQEWLWKRWFMMGQIATAGFLRRYFHHLHLRLRLMQELQQPQQQQQQQPQPTIQPQNIHHHPPPPPPPHLLLRPPPPPLRPLLHPLRLHPQQQQQQRQQLLGTQQAQEEEQRQLQGQLGQEGQALQTTLEQHQSSERRQQQDRLQFSWTPQILLPLLQHHLPKLKTSPISSPIKVELYLS